MRGTLIAVGALVALTSTAHAQLELKNDAWSDGDQVAFHGGFVTGEIVAVRYVAPAAGRQLLRIDLLYGQITSPMTQVPVTVKVWDDPGPGNAPGAELYSGDFELTDQNNIMQQIDLTTDNVIVTQQFRVGIVAQHSGSPSPANDTEGAGPTSPSKNFIFAMPGGWLQTSSVGIGGDWIIRAFVSDTGGPLPDAATGPGTPDASMSGGQCNGNTDCSVGSYCDTNTHACTFDCHEDTDCGGENVCNSLGQCVEGGGGGGGCSTGGDQDGALVLLCGLGVMTLLVRRRRG